MPRPEQKPVLSSIRHIPAVISSNFNTIHRNKCTHKKIRKITTHDKYFPKSIEDGWLIGWRVVADEKNVINLGGNFEKRERRYDSIPIAGGGWVEERSRQIIICDTDG
uniref:Uncharacterized protein n=1 Tax=Wuchereria bancrofti TaxID=6293 RepID=A0A1I8EGP4_WUCBA